MWKISHKSAEYVVYMVGEAATVNEDEIPRVNCTSTPWVVAGVPEVAKCKHDCQNLKKIVIKCQKPE